MAMRLVRALPARWDGVPVRWGDWMPGESASTRAHMPPDPCAECGSTRGTLLAAGRIVSLTDRSGVPRWPIRFHACRCLDCLHDVVYDQWNDETWDLGPEDYGPAGSTEVIGALW